MGAKIKRLVFDTNIVISALIFKSKSENDLRFLWAQSHFIPLVSKETTEEFIRVLAYPKFKLSRMEQETLRNEYLAHAEVCIRIKKSAPHYICRDPFDQKFIDLSLSSTAEGLVTGDQDILIMQKKFPIPIYQLSDLKKLVQELRI